MRILQVAFLLLFNSLFLWDEHPFLWFPPPPPPPLDEEWQQESDWNEGNDYSVTVNYAPKGYDKMWWDSLDIM